MSSSKKFTPRFCDGKDVDPKEIRVPLDAAETIFTTWKNNRGWFDNRVAVFVLKTMESFGLVFDIPTASKIKVLEDDVNANQVVPFVPNGIAIHTKDASGFCQETIKIRSFACIQKESEYLKSRNQQQGAFHDFIIAAANKKSCSECYKVVEYLKKTNVRDDKKKTNEETRGTLSYDQQKVMDQLQDALAASKLSLKNVQQQLRREKIKVVKQKDILAETISCYKQMEKVRLKEDEAAFFVKATELFVDQTEKFLKTRGCSDAQIAAQVSLFELNAEIMKRGIDSGGKMIGARTGLEVPKELFVVMLEMSESLGKKDYEEYQRLNPAFFTWTHLKRLCTQYSTPRGIQHDNLLNMVVELWRHTDDQGTYIYRSSLLGVGPPIMLWISFDDMILVTDMKRNNSRNYGLSSEYKSPLLTALECETAQKKITEEPENMKEAVKDCLSRNKINALFTIVATTPSGPRLNRVVYSDTIGSTTTQSLDRILDELNVAFAFHNMAYIDSSSDAAMAHISAKNLECTHTMDALPGNFGTNTYRIHPIFDGRDPSGSRCLKQFNSRDPSHGVKNASAFLEPAMGHEVQVKIGDRWCLCSFELLQSSWHCVNAGNAAVRYFDNYSTTTFIKKSTDRMNVELVVIGLSPDCKEIVKVLKERRDREILELNNYEVMLAKKNNPPQPSLLLPSMNASGAVVMSTSFLTLGSAGQSLPYVNTDEVNLPSKPIPSFSYDIIEKMDGFVYLADLLYKLFRYLTSKVGQSMHFPKTVEMVEWLEQTFIPAMMDLETQSITYYQDHPYNKWDKKKNAHVLGDDENHYCFSKKTVRVLISLAQNTCQFLRTYGYDTIGNVPLEQGGKPVRWILARRNSDHCEHLYAKVRFMSKGQRLDEYETMLSLRKVMLKSLFPSHHPRLKKISENNKRNSLSAVEMCEADENIDQEGGADFGFDILDVLEDYADKIGGDSAEDTESSAEDTASSAEEFAVAVNDDLVLRGGLSDLGLGPESLLTDTMDEATLCQPVVLFSSILSSAAKTPQAIRREELSYMLTQMKSDPIRRLVDYRSMKSRHADAITSEIFGDNAWDNFLQRRQALGENLASSSSSSLAASVPQQAVAVPGFPLGGEVQGPAPAVAPISEDDRNFHHMTDDRFTELWNEHGMGK